MSYDVHSSSRQHRILLSEINNEVMAIIAMSVVAIRLRHGEYVSAVAILNILICPEWHQPNYKCIYAK